MIRSEAEAENGGRNKDAAALVAGAGADPKGLLPGPGGGLIRAALIMVGCLAACSGSTPGKTTTPAKPTQKRPAKTRQEKPTAQQIVERYLQGPPGYRQAVADHKAGREDRVEVFFDRAVAALKELVDLKRVDEHSAIRALQMTYNRERCLQLYGAFEREEGDLRRQKQNLRGTLKSWEPVEGCVVRPGAAADKRALHPVTFPLVPQGALLARINSVHRRLGTARVVAARCKADRRTRVFALGDDDRIIAIDESGPVEPVAIPDRFVRFITPKPDEKPPPPPRIRLTLSAVNKDARAKLTVPHPAVRKRLRAIPANARALGPGEVPLPLELSGLMEGDVIAGTISAQGHVTHRFSKTIDAPHQFRRLGMRVRFEDGDRWYLHFFLVAKPAR